MSALTYALASENFNSDQSWLGGLFTESEEETVAEEDLLLADALWSEEASPEPAATSAPVEAAPLPLRNPWSVDLSVGGGPGYRENALFGTSDREVDSAFYQVDFDAFAMRSFSAGRGDFAAVAFGELRNYDAVPGLSTEHLFAMNSWLGWDFTDSYRGILRMEAMHSKQAVDASINDFETEALAVSVFRPGVVAALEREFGELGTLQAFTGYRDSNYSEEREDYGALTYGLEWRQNVGERSRLKFGWERFAEDYDLKTARWVGEQMENAPLLELDGDRFEFEWLWSAGDGYLRRSRFSANYETENDRVGDYYARSRMKLRQGLEWRFGRWELDTGVSLDQLDYDHRTVSAESDELRSDEAWRWDVELGRDIGENWHAFVRHENAFKDSSDPTYEYESSTTYLGVKWNFLSR